MRPISTTSRSPSTRPEADTPVFAAFAAAPLAAHGIALRRIAHEDAGLVAAIYASTREEELRLVPWSDAQKKAFTEWQSRMQEQHYALHYPDAELLLVAMEGTALGRIYVDVSATETRLMDVTLLPAHRNRGIGTHLMHALLDFADAHARMASLHVEPFNPARRLYERLGFRGRETRGLYEFMVRPRVS
jgi:ribosomal protein S18 acetylase RimI-like enzyme